MSGNIQESFTHRAAVKALPFSVAPIIFDLLKHFSQNVPWLSVTVSIVKVLVISTLLYLLMKKYTDDTGYVPYSKSFKYGFLVCLFSSIICTLWSILSFYVIFPDTLDTIIEAVTVAFDQMKVDMDYDDIVNIIPPALVISSFISCLIWGVLLSAIMAVSAKNDTPFDDVEEQEEEEE